MRVNMTDDQDGVPITLFGARVIVASGDTLLRLLQSLQPECVTAAGFCWVADCHTCEVQVKFPSGEVDWVLACETPVKPGIEIVDASQKLKACLKARPALHGRSGRG